MPRKLLPLLLLLVGAGGLAALALTRPQPEPLAPREKVWVVAVQPAAPQTLSPSLTLFARVDSPRAATLTAAVNADVLEVSALEGRPVAAGELLVRLDDRDARLSLAQREADVAELRAELASELRRHENDRAALKHELDLLELARRDVARAERLATRDLGSAARLDEARQAEARQALAVDSRRTAIAEHDSRTAALAARIARAEALVEVSQLDLERTRVRAPFDGRIAAVEVAPGDRVRPGDRLLDLFDASALELRAQVPTRYLRRLRESLDLDTPATAEARVDGRPVRSVLDRLGAEVERGRGGADALFKVLDAAQIPLELGRTVELTVLLPPVADVVPIPAEALYGTDRVYLLEDSRMRGITVERVGEHHDRGDGRRLLVKSPELTPGARIIATQLPNAVDGLKVRAE